MASIANMSNESKFQVLSEWKKTYAEAVIDTLSPAGDVLQVGFGDGFAADRIQSRRPKTHLIIESDPQVLADAIKWADRNPNVTVIQGEWETILPNLGKFDVIFFNDYQGEDDLAIMNFLFPEETLQTSSQAKELLNSIEEKMSQLTMQFSDRDIEDFYQKIGQFNLKELPKFFQKLKDNGNISKTQYHNSIKKYHLNELEKETTKKSEGCDKKPDNTLLFLEKCLKNHMNNNSRFSCLLNNQASKYEDSQFFENIITNPNVDYKETLVPVKTADKTRKALIMIVRRE